MSIKRLIDITQNNDKEKQEFNDKLKKASTIQDLKDLLSILYNKIYN